jgi:hypothetical protein
MIVVLLMTASQIPGTLLMSPTGAGGTRMSAKSDLHDTTEEMTEKLFSFLREFGEKDEVLQAITGIAEGLVSETMRYGTAAAYGFFQRIADEIVMRYGGEGMEGA